LATGVGSDDGGEDRLREGLPVPRRGWQAAAAAAARCRASRNPACAPRASPA